MKWSALTSGNTEISYISPSKSPIPMNKLVYIVEDDPVHQKMLEVHFEELGNYAVRTYTNPEDMMNNLHEKPFAIVLDHFFGVRKTGLDYLKELKKKKLGIPVIHYS